MSVLSKGLTFCPESDIDRFEITKDLQLFARKLFSKSMYNKDTLPIKKRKTLNEIDLDNTIELADEQDGLDLIDRIDLETLLEENITTKEEKKNQKLSPT